MANIQTGAAYIRVSTEDQTEYSPDAQLSAIYKFAKANKIIIPDEYIFIDEGISGRKAEKRPAFMRMIGIAKTTKPQPFEVILVHKFDRFARNREDSVVYKSLLRKDCGIKVISITENIEDDKFNLILESMLEAMAEYYSLNLAEEVKKGMTEKAKRGEPQTIAPFGYTMKDKQFFVNNEESKIIKMIYNSFLSGANYLDITRQVNALGIHTHRGNSFENRTIEYILRNPVYIGKLRWNPTGRTNRKYNHPDIMIVDGHHEPIIQKEDFDKVQEKINEIKKVYTPYYKSQSSPSHWLVGLLKCGNCNGSMIKQTRAFQCNNYVKGKCKTSHALSIKIAENAVLEQLKIIIYNNSIGNIKLINKSENPNINQELVMMKKQLISLNTKLDRVKKAYQNGIDTLEEYKLNKNIIENDINILTFKIENMKPSADDKLDSKKFIKELKKYYTLLSSDKIDMAEKYKISHSFISNIAFDKENYQLIITFYI